MFSRSRSSQRGAPIWNWICPEREPSLDEAPDAGVRKKPAPWTPFCSDCGGWRRTPEKGGVWEMAFVAEPSELLRSKLPLNTPVSAREPLMKDPSTKMSPHWIKEWGRAEGQKGYASNRAAKKWVDGVQRQRRSARSAGLSAWRGVFGVHARAASHSVVAERGVVSPLFADL